MDIGLPTLQDIISELKKPGRDPRDELSKPVLRSDIIEIKDLKPNMILKGTVRNVVDFGIFVDIGVGQDGLVHISQISEKYIRHPLDVVQAGDIVDVKVIDIDVSKKKDITINERYINPKYSLIFYKQWVIILTEINNELSGQGEIPDRRYSPRVPCRD